MNTQSGPMQEGERHSSMDARKTWKAIHLSRPTLQNPIAPTKRTSKIMESGHDSETSSTVKQNLHVLYPTFNTSIVKTDPTAELITKALTPERRSKSRTIERKLHNARPGVDSEPIHHPPTTLQLDIAPTQHTTMKSRHDSGESTKFSTLEQNLHDLHPTFSTSVVQKQTTTEMLKPTLLTESSSTTGNIVQNIFKAIIPLSTESIPVDSIHNGSASSPISFNCKRAVMKRLELTICRVDNLKDRLQDKHNISPELREWINSNPFQNDNDFCNFLREERKYCKAVRNNGISHMQPSNSTKAGIIHFNFLAILT
ncbi:unnamed protein product [Orchesella dallaii]|uniref:Uncharacterized protein n=1 Tax=Orchesella dallaii TaxID=48710 RepID=A0ABP1SA24_9HEXA